MAKISANGCHKVATAERVRETRNAPDLASYLVRTVRTLRSDGTVLEAFACYDHGDCTTNDPHKFHASARRLGAHKVRSKIKAGMTGVEWIATYAAAGWATTVHDVVSVARVLRPEVV